MKHLTTLLFALSIILINPWGTSRGDIWTQPKLLAVLMVVSLSLTIIWLKRKEVTVSRGWVISFMLWVIFLGIGVLSTLQSPFPLRSLYGVKVRWEMAGCIG